MLKQQTLPAIYQNNVRRLLSFFRLSHIHPSHRIYITCGESSLTSLHRFHHQQPTSVFEVVYNIV